MTTDRDRVLSEFIDSWNAGRRPSIDEHLKRVADEERAELEHDITSFISWAETPDYDDSTVAAIRAEPEVAAALASYRMPAGVLAALLPQWRQRLSMSTGQLARAVVKATGVTSSREEKVRTYLERVEAGELEPSGFSTRLIDALAKALNVPRQRIESAAATLRSIAAPPAAASPGLRFRAAESAAESVRDDLELMADAMATKSEREWDEVDELFRGGR